VKTRTGQKRVSLILEAINNGYGVSDNIRDECARTVTNNVANYYDLHQAIIFALNPSALIG